MAEDTTTENKKGNWFKRHKVLTVILAVILIGAIGSAMGGDKAAETKSSTADNASQEEKKPDTTAKLNQAARDGKFEFVVKSVECGKESVGGQYLSKTAQGQYCLITMSVKNIGDKPQSLFSSNQKLFNDAGQEYSADDTATIYNAPSDSSGTWFSEINPGNTVEGAIVFDVPKDQKVVRAELHDSAASMGVKVSLE